MRSTVPGSLNQGNKRFTLLKVHYNYFIKKYLSENP